MTAEKAMQVRRNPETEDVDNEELHKVIDEALEKQIPKKPIICSDRRKTDYKCTCGHILYKVYELGTAMGNKFNYCEHCGQALDWSDTK